MTILVSGSIALDHIMVFPDRFKDHILPDKIHILNVSFNIESLKTHFGGVAGNIAYHLRLLGEDPLILATAGNDFGPYAEWLDRHGIRRSAIRVLDEVPTAQGFVTTDLDDNQIWAFYEGAMARAHEASVEDVTETLDLAIVSADGKRAMIEHARALKRRGVPTFIDPSHGLPMLDREELLELIDGAAAYIVNDYEWALTLQQTGCTEDELVARCEAVVITLGERGSSIRCGEDRIEIPPVRAAKLVDPTACGDAYRAGLAYGRVHGLPFETAGRMGSLLGAFQVEVDGPQNLSIDLETFRARFEREFGSGF
ncbi:MAG: carbohydrate kinase family protein [Planctomycetes bacterium]|nr:carbohydrate kinase family protein [Planctomycetota bacterium]